MQVREGRSKGRVPARADVVGQHRPHPAVARVLNAEKEMLAQGKCQQRDSEIREFVSLPEPWPCQPVITLADPTRWQNREEVEVEGRPGREAWEAQGAHERGYPCR